MIINSSVQTNYEYHTAESDIAIRLIVTIVPALGHRFLRLGDNAAAPGS